MKNRLLIALALLFLLSTYNFKERPKFEKKFTIQEIIIENNSYVEDSLIKKHLSNIYQKNIFFLKSKNIELQLAKIDLIKSFKIKKIYPNKIKIIIFERQPFAIIQNKKEKKYFTRDGSAIKYLPIKEFENLPTVFGDEKNFKIFYNNLEKTNFPLNEIKTFFLFETKRWDLITIDNKTIKLPIADYDKSLENFVKLKDQTNFSKYNIFDYRIYDQLILK